MTAPPLTALTLNSRLDISELHPLLTWSQMIHLSFSHPININEWFNLMNPGSQLADRVLQFVGASRQETHPAAALRTPLVY